MIEGILLEHHDQRLHQLLIFDLALLHDRRHLLALLPAHMHDDVGHGTGQDFVGLGVLLLQFPQELDALPFKGLGLFQLAGRLLMEPGTHQGLSEGRDGPQDRLFSAAGTGPHHRRPGRHSSCAP